MEKQSVFEIIPPSTTKIPFILSIPHSGTAFPKEFHPIYQPNQLEKLLNKFNVFDVLKSAKTEIRHSNVLAWLLDPNESHNIGDKALKLFLESIPSDVDLTSLINGSSKISVEVLREWEDIDISILIKSGSKRFLIIIENKTKTNLKKTC